MLRFSCEGEGNKAGFMYVPVCDILGLLQIKRNKNVLELFCKQKNAFLFLFLRLDKIAEALLHLQLIMSLNKAYLGKAFQALCLEPVLEYAARWTKMKC